VEAASNRITVTAPDGLNLAGVVHGPADGPPIVFLHGGGQSRAAWRGAAKRLGAAGYKACTIDLRGHGDSDWSETMGYGFDDYVGDLAAVIVALGDRPATIVGASLGGHIGLLTSARFPERVRVLMMADVTPWIDEDSGDAMRADLRAANHGFASVDEASAMVSRLRGTPPPAGGSGGLVRHLRQGDDGRFYFRWDVRLMNDALLRGGGEGGPFQTAAARLQVPVLVMRAEHSTLTSPEQVAAFRKVHTDVEEVIIAGAGHMVSGDVNDVYADAIMAYLAANSTE
jgi:pimeloyl-ACP methyl ester carboxylesterase